MSTHNPIAQDVDGTERLSADDMATQREAQFLAASLAHHRAASTQRQAKPGTCANCGAACLPLAVYCDEDCQADHAHRQQILARQGRAR